MKYILFPLPVGFPAWKRKVEDMCLFLCLVNFSNAKVIEICVSCNLSVEPMNVRLWLYRSCFSACRDYGLLRWSFKATTYLYLYSITWDRHFTNNAGFLLLFCFLFKTLVLFGPRQRSVYGVTRKVACTAEEWKMWLQYRCLDMI